MRHTRSECGACGAVFAGVRVFDAHRVGPYIPGGRHCLTSSEMLAKGMIQDKRRWWYSDPGQSDPTTRYGSIQQRSERRASA